MRVGNEVTNGGGCPLIMEGLLAARPAVITTGSIYIQTDAPYSIFRFNGVGWQQIGSSGPDQNFANTNLTATANRLHDFAGFDLQIDDIAQLEFNADIFHVTSLGEIIIISLASDFDLISSDRMFLTSVNEMNLTSLGGIDLHVNNGDIDVRCDNGEIDIHSDNFGNYMSISPDGLIRIVSKNSKDVFIDGSANAQLQAAGTAIVNGQGVLIAAASGDIDATATGDITVTADGNLYLLSDGGFAALSDPGFSNYVAISPGGPEIQSASDISLRADSNISIVADDFFQIETLNAGIAITSGQELSLVSQDGSVISLNSADLIDFTSDTVKYRFNSVPDYLNNAAAIVGGLSVGMIYRLTATGALQIVF